MASEKSALGPYRTLLLRQAATGTAKNPELSCVCWRVTVKLKGVKELKLRA